MSDVTTKMRLTAVRITNFGCFRDSGEVPIADVTALIAENENGKTTFLRALAWWDDDTKFDRDDLWDGADQAATTDLVALTFEATKASSDALRAVGAKAPRFVRVICNSESDYRVEDADTGDEVKPSKGRTRFELARDTLAEALASHEDAGPTAEILPELVAASKDSEPVQELLDRVRSEVVPEVEADSQQSLDAVVDELETALSAPDEDRPKDAITVIEPFLPKFVYFDDRVDFVQDAVRYEEVAANKAAHRTMINLAEIAGVDLVQVANETPHRRQQFSRSAEKTLSEDFSQYWHGDPVTVYVQLDESQMTLTIEHRGRTQRPSRRSSGLKWQLGFFVNFTAEVKGELAGAVLLLDEPGLHLHIKQQPMLLQLFDALAKAGCRIIYATHFGHMLDPAKPHAYRPLIPDPKATHAVQVVPNITALPSRSDVMQPVRQVLGMGIADAIGLGGSNVIAEGWAERYVLLAMSEICRDAGKEALGLTTTVLPAGGSGKKTLPLAAMAVAENTRAAVLVDDDKAGRSTVTVLNKALPGAVPAVRTHEEEQPTDRELEDLFAPSFYLQLVNASHEELDGYTDLTENDIDLSKPICDEVEKKFKSNTKLGKFQKLRPAMELQKLHELGEKPDDATIDRFADLFKRLNAALKRS